MKRIENLLTVCEASGDNLLISGSMGIGKSESVGQYAKKEGKQLVTLLLSQNEVGDLIGIPHIKNQITEWTIPSWLDDILTSHWPASTTASNLTFKDTKLRDYMKATKDDYTLNGVIKSYNEYYKTQDGKFQILRNLAVQNDLSVGSVLFLDEMNRANRDVLASALALVLDKKLHTHYLPQNCMVVSAINPAGGKYQVDRFDPALINRFLYTEVKANAQHWLSWAKKNNVNKTVIAFIDKFPEKIESPDDEKYASATPRSLTMLGNSLTVLEEKEIQNEEILKTIIFGKVGTSFGSQFYNFYKEFSKSISTEEIEKIVKKQIDTSLSIKDNIKKVSSILKETLKDQEEVILIQLINKFISKYEEFSENLPLSDDDRFKIFPLIAMLYSVSLEIVTSIYSEHNNPEKPKIRTFLATLDNRELIIKIYTIVEKK